MYIYYFSVRLVGGTSVLEGRVEVLYRGVWGTVCADGDRQAGDIVCRQLAYDGATATPSHQPFSRGTGVIWLDNLQCSGDETSLGKCRHDGWGVIQYCYHSTDLSVVCTPPGFYLIYKILYCILYSQPYIK